MTTKAQQQSLPKYVAELARLVDSRWRFKHYDSSTFADIATTALAELPAKAHLTPNQVLRWAATTENLPMQDGPANRFGEPAIRLFDNGRFFIQVLFWFESTTSIHQHSFSGAFEVLSGSSIHARYAFDAKHRYSEHLLAGDLSVRLIEVLEAGSVRTILTGDRFIHSLFHLDYPSVSFLVRTHNDVESGPLYSYLKPGIAINSFHSTPRMRLLREVLIASARLSQTALDDFARLAVGTADLEAAVHVLLLYRDLLPSTDWPRLPKALSQLMLQTTPKTMQPTLAQVMVAQERTRQLVAARQQVYDQDLRYFLALLINTSSRKELLSLVRQRFPDASPVERVVEWTRQLWQTPATTDEGEPSNLLHLECDEAVKGPALQVLAAMLKGKAEQLVVSSMPKYRGIARICRLWRDQPFLQPLFSR